MNCTIFKKVFCCCVILISCFSSIAQKNSIGFSGIYQNAGNLPYNEILSYDNTKNNKSQPTIHHFASIALLYERELEEYLYAQANLNISYTNSNTTNLKIDLQGGGIMINVNWYPIKMIKNLKKTAMNPLYFRFGGGSDYWLNHITKTTDTTFEKNTLTSICPFAELGFGYDLHFGKRLVVQPFFGIRKYFMFYNDDFELVVTNRTDSGLPLKESALMLKTGVSFLFLF